MSLLQTNGNGAAVSAIQHPPLLNGAGMLLELHLCFSAAFKCGWLFQWKKVELMAAQQHCRQVDGKKEVVIIISPASSNQLKSFSFNFLFFKRGKQLGMKNN